MSTLYIPSLWSGDIIRTLPVGRRKRPLVLPSGEVRAEGSFRCRPRWCTAASATTTLCGRWPISPGTTHRSGSTSRAVAAKVWVRKATCGTSQPCSFAQLLLALLCCPAVRPTATSTGSLGSHAQIGSRPSGAI